MIYTEQSTNHTSLKNRLRCYATSVLMINLLNLAMLLFFQKSMAVIMYWTACVWTERVGGGGGWILIQFHFKMCKMKHYSLLFPFFPSPLPPASFRFISVYDLACLDVAMYRLMMYTLVHGYEGCHCPFLPRVVQSHFSYIMDQIAAGGFSQLKQSIL